MLDGPRHVLPSTLIWTGIFGSSTLAMLAWQNKLRAAADAEKEPAKPSWLAKWSPLQRLSNEDYEKILEKKILELDAQIAIIDDSIAEMEVLKASNAKKALEAANKPRSEEAPKRKASSWWN